MKKIVLIAILIIASFSAFCSVTVRYDNMDDKGYTMLVVIDATEKEVHFDIGRSKLVVLGGNNVCVIETRCGKVEVRDGDSIYIQDGCIKVRR